MRILLTGACGKLGMAVRKVGAADHQFVLMDVAERVMEEGGTCASVTDTGAVRQAIEGCDAVIHTAAMHGSARDTATNRQFIETNVIGAENLFEAALDAGVKRLVMSSSMEVIYGKTWDAYGTAVTDETTSPRPDWIYPVTKHQVEILSSFYAREHGLEVINLRYSNILTGPVRKLAFQLLARGAHADDHARANVLAATKPGLTEAVLHCAPLTPLRRTDIHAAMADPWPTLEKYWPGSRSVLDAAQCAPQPKDFWPVTRIDHTRQLLGWQPTVTFTDFLRELGWRAP